MSEVEIDLCKYIHKVEELKQKIEKEGYDNIGIKEIHDISILKTSPLVKGLQGFEIIENGEHKTDQLVK